MNEQENQLYEELRENAIKCNELMDKIYYKKLQPKELKLEYKNLKNSCKNRLSQIKNLENQMVFNKIFLIHSLVVMKKP